MKETLRRFKTKELWAYCAAIAPALVLAFAMNYLDGQTTHAQQGRATQEPDIIGGRELTPTELIDVYDAVPVPIQFSRGSGERQSVYGGSAALAAKLVNTDTVRVLLGTAGHLWQQGDETVTWGQQACPGVSDLRECEAEGTGYPIDDAYVDPRYIDINGLPHFDSSVAQISMPLAEFQRIYGPYTIAELQEGVKLSYIGGATVVIDGQAVVLDANYPVSGTVLEVIGGGRHERSTPAKNDVMRLLTQTVYSDTFMTVLYPDDFDDETMIGIGDITGETDTCIGDSGMPLFIRLPNGKLLVIAYVSWGKTSCAIPGDVAVNTKAFQDLYKNAIHRFIQTGRIIRYQMNLPLAMSK